MDYGIINILALLGSVCLFLYGMKIMSEGLQKSAGKRLRSILAWMTKNRFLAVVTGVIITALIQSSSASVSMVVSFVNAGLMPLEQSLAVSFGYNVHRVDHRHLWFQGQVIGIPVALAGLCRPDAVHETQQLQEHR